MSLEGIYRDQDINEGIVFRLARIDDIKAVIKILRLGFPDVLQFFVPKVLAERWRRFIVDSQFGETWVCELRGQVVGLIMMAIDIDKYEKDKHKARPGLGIRLCSLAIHPNVLIRKIREKMYRGNSDKAPSSDGSNLKRLCNKPIRIMPYAVLPNMRNRGIGTHIMNFCERRGRELGCDSIKVTVKKNNKGAIRLYERMGFRRAGASKNFYAYIKLLSEACL